MSYETLLYQKTDQIGNITLNRPRSNNSINERLAEEMFDLCSEIQRDSNVRVVTITGAGTTFCMGTEWDGQVSVEIASSKQWSVATTVAKLDLPVIAAINGDAIGQGLELALACDIRIASNTACFGFPHIISGLIPWDGGTQRLPRLVGRAKAMEMILTGESISAEEAFRVGLVTKIVGLGELSKAVAEMAQGVASRAPTAIKYAKEAVNKGLDITLEQGLRLEADLYFLLHTTKDRTEGIRAFHEKRRPKFKGK
ncbi:enoyl-CoA hydratase/isomerase family protein [Chloroflexota bacterium]